MSGRNSASAINQRAGGAANEGAVVICAGEDDPYNPFLDWTIALDADLDRATRYANQIMSNIGSSCDRIVRCEGGWYAVVFGTKVGDDRHGGVLGAACGHNNRSHALQDARERCSKLAAAGTCGRPPNGCISGRTTNERQELHRGAVWMGNEYTEGCL